MNGVEEITVKLGKGYSELHLKCIDWPNVSVFVLLLLFNFNFSWMQMLLGWILEDIGFKEQKAKKSLYHYYFHSGIVFILNIGFWLFFVHVKISAMKSHFHFPMIMCHIYEIGMRHHFRKVWNEIEDLVSTKKVLTWSYLCKVIFYLGVIFLYNLSLAILVLPKLCHYKMLHDEQSAKAVSSPQLPSAREKLSHE